MTQRGPYSLVVLWTDGRTTEIANGHNPQEVREAERKVSRNPTVIDRIELRDLEGPLETIWARGWAGLGGVDP